MSTINDILGSSPVFKSIEAAAIEKMGSLFEKRDIYPGDMIATACEPAQNFFVLAKGSVLLGMEDGKSVVLNHPGDFIAMELLSAKGIYKTSVSVLEKGQVYVILRDDFLKIIQEDTPMAQQIMEAWQIYLDQTAPFAAKIENFSLSECF
ncbi:MAG: cyclic nucleotide-binding domain-containing protein [Pseudomonadota bacterium]